MADGAKLRDQQETIRIPLCGQPDQRFSDTGSTGTSYQVQDQTLVNCYPVVEQDPTGQSPPSVTIRSRLGWNAPEPGVIAEGASKLSDCTTTYALEFCPIEAIPGEIIVAYKDGTDIKICLYKPFTNYFEKLGTIARGSDYPEQWDTFIHISELSLGTGNTPACGIIVTCGSTNKSVGYYITSASGTFASTTMTQITDAQFPANNSMRVVSPLVQLNENIYVLTENGYIYNSELDGTGDAQIVNWDPDGNFPTSNKGDEGVGLVRYKHHLIAFGGSTMEFFADEGVAAPASPLAPMQQAFINIGCINQKAYCKVGDTLYWVSSSIHGDVALYKLDGYTPVRLGSAYSAVKLSDRPYEIHLQAIVMHGSTHLVTNKPADGPSWVNDGVENGDTVTGANSPLYGVWCYCVESKTWWIWAVEGRHGRSGNESYPKYLFGSSYDTSGNLAKLMWYQGKGNGYSYGNHPCVAYSYADSEYNCFDTFRLDDETTLDSWRVPVLVQTGYFDFGNNDRKFLRSVELIGHDISPFVSTQAPTPAFYAEGLTLNLGIDRTGYLDSSDVYTLVRSQRQMIEDEFVLRTSLTTTTTSVDVNGEIPTDTPTTGYLCIDTDAGGTVMATYTSWANAGGNGTFTINSYNFTATPCTAGVDVSLRRLPDIVPRWIFNNLGAFRRIRFAIAMNVFSPITWEALELTIAQGTH